MFSGKMIIPKDDVRTDNNKGELDRERPTKARDAQDDPFFFGGFFLPYDTASSKLSSKPRITAGK